MSIFAYFSKRHADHRMPRSFPGLPDNAGITWNGPVLNGHIGVRAAIDLDARLAQARRASGSSDFASDLSLITNGSRARR